MSSNTHQYTPAFFLFEQQQQKTLWKGPEYCDKKRIYNSLFYGNILPRWNKIVHG